MPRFSFKARDLSGSAVTGHREAIDAASLAKELSAAGMTATSIVSDEREAVGSSLDLRGLFEKKVDSDELILLSHQMASLTRAGVPVDRALRGLAESQRNPRLQHILEDISASLESGSDVATALRRYPRVFNELYASVIHVGENTGRLDRAFKQIAGYLEMERETKRRINASTRYPLFVLATIGIGIGILNVFVIPAFAKVFDKFHAQLPWQTRVIVAISDFTVQFWPLILLGIFAAGLAARRYVKTPEGRLSWDRWKLKIPVLGGMYQRINLSRFCQTFAMVSRAGIPITQGLLVTSRAIGNEFMAERVNLMRQGIERGSSISVTARESGMFSPVVLQMLAVGEETGSVDDLMEQAAGFYSEEVDYQLKTLTDALEPVLIIAIGAMVLVLALGVFLPLWELSSVAIK